MALQTFNWANLPVQESPYGNLIENIFKGYQIGRAPEQMNEEQLKRQLANKLSQMEVEHKPTEYALGDKSKQLAIALQSATLKNLPMEQQYKLELLKQRIASEQQKGVKTKLMADILQKYINKDAGESMQENGSPEMPVDTQEDMSRQEQARAAEAMLASKLAGFDPKVIDVDGVKTAVTPFGNFPLAKGQTPLQKELTKQDAKAIADLENVARKGLEAAPTLDQLAEITSNPTFQSMRKSDLAPGLELEYYLRKGSPEQKELAGNFLTYANAIIKDSSRDFAGQFRVGEQELLEKMKLSPKDTLPVAQGKLEALMLMRQLMTDRASIASDLARNQGMSPLKAIETAEKRLDVKKIKDEIKNKVGIKSASLKLPEWAIKKGYSMKDVEDTAKQNNMTVEQVIRKMEAHRG